MAQLLSDHAIPSYSIIKLFQDKMTSAAKAIAQITLHSSNQVSWLYDAMDHAVPYIVYFDSYPAYAGFNIKVEGIRHGFLFFIFLSAQPPSRISHSLNALWILL